MKNCDIFPIFAQNIDCGYDLSFRAKIRKIIYTHVNPNFTTIKVECKGA